MDDFENYDIFSSEALRLPDGLCNPHGPVLQPENMLGGTAVVNVSPDPVRPSNRNSNSQTCDIPGYMTIDFNHQKRKRATFDDAGRAKVASYADNVDASALGDGRASLAFATKPLAMSVNLNMGGWTASLSLSSKWTYSLWVTYLFAHCLWIADTMSFPDFPCSQDKYNSIISGFHFFIEYDKEQSFTRGIFWDLDAVSSDCAKWICEEHVKPASNGLLWILSSLEAEKLLSGFLNTNLTKALRVLVNMSAILYGWDDPPAFSFGSCADLWSIRSFAGSQVLHNLETLLVNNKIAKSSRDVLKALFLLLFGIIIAVGYTGSVSQSDERGEPPRLTVEAFTETRQQLLRVLAHHMILIAERVGLLSDHNAKDRLLEQAYRQWSEKELIEWTPASPSLRTCHGGFLEGEAVPDSFYSTLEDISTDHSASHGENYKDSEAQGDLSLQKSLPHEGGAFSDLYQSRLVIDEMTLHVPDMTNPSQLWKAIAEEGQQREAAQDHFSNDDFYHLSESNKGIANLDSGYFPDQSFDHSDDGFFNSSGTEAETIDPKQRALPEVFNGTPRDTEVALDGIDGVDWFFHEAPCPKNSYHQAPTCSTAQMPDMTWPTPHLDNDLSFRDASDTATEKAAYQPPSQYRVEMSIFVDEIRLLDGCLIPIQGETQTDPSNPRGTNYDLAQTLTAFEPLDFTMSSQTFEDLESADPAFNFDTNAAMISDKPSPSDLFEDVTSSSLAVSTPPPKSLRRRNSRLPRPQMSFLDLEAVNLLHDSTHGRHCSRLSDLSEAESKDHLERWKDQYGVADATKRKLPKLLV